MTNADWGVFFTPKIGIFGFGKRGEKGAIFGAAHLVFILKG